MKAKTYKAKSIQDAVDRIKRELGPDAMILSTRRVAKGPMNPYGADYFEVTAEPGTPPATRPATPPVTPAHAKPPLKTGQPKPGSIDARMELLAKAFPDKIPGTSPKPAAQPQNTDAWESVNQELGSIRDLLVMMSQTSPNVMNINPSCLKLYARLVKSGISETRARRFMAGGGAFGENGESYETIQKNVIRSMMSSITTSSIFNGLGKTREIAAVVGPTGVGKTTTVAKLAAELALKQKATVGLISIDGYRIGALDQLKTYASIIGLPCLSAFTKQELVAAIKKFSDKDVILVDTAGQSHMDKERLGELARVMKCGAGISTHLVLSANIKPSDMKRAAENFAVLNPESYIFSKVDETETRGGIVDQVMEKNLPISFLTNGQGVPEDIMAADRKEIMQLVLN